MSVPTTDPSAVASRAAIVTAMKSKEHLRAWLDASGRRWLVFNGIDLLDALTFPEGVEVLMTIIEAYRDHRRTIPTGRVETMVHPDTRASVEVPGMKGETLEPEELDRAIRYLVEQMRKHKPDYSLEDAPL